MARRNEWWRLVTHGFVHADWMHLIVNMFTFYSFGRYIEQYFAVLHFGRGAFLLLYFGGMVAASVYDVWKYRDNAYYLFGWAGQLGIVLPDYDAAVSLTSYEFQTQALLDAVWDTIVPQLR